MQYDKTLLQKHIYVGTNFGINTSSYAHVLDKLGKSINFTCKHGLLWFGEGLESFFTTFASYHQPFELTTTSARTNQR